MLNETMNENRLANEKSPYLLQHKNNPVDWYPWGDEAFERAKKEDKPVFLSIGYSTCHWCHVMERESFEDTEVAEVLNENYVSIKVDREERPDIDHIYMSVCQILTGQGGWPLSIFLTPDKKPFYAGTYFPKQSRMGMPGFITLLTDIKKVWDVNRNGVLSSSEEITKALQQEINIKGEIPGKNLINTAFSQLKGNFDFVYGGFGSAPKFPSPHNLFFLTRYYYVTKNDEALSMVTKTLDAMYKGGIYDHIGSGFCRYSTDRKWFAPHFEKMLYDNALISIAYLEAYQITKKKLYLDIATGVLDYIIRDMTSPEGGFYSAEDADSEGVEGKFYLWTREEAVKALGETDGIKFCEIYDINIAPNFEEGNIPNLIKTQNITTEDEFIKQCKKKLFEHREERIHPFKDDKVITSWNGLMIAAMSIAGRVTGNGKYTDAAKRSVDFILKKLVQNGRLMSNYRDGTVKNLGFVDDYSFLIWGLIELYETTFEPFYLQKALDLNNDLLKYFWDENAGGLFIYGNDAQWQITRPKEIFDGAIPSANSVSTHNFLRLARLTSNTNLEEKAYEQFKAFGQILSSSPLALTFLLSSFIYAMNKSGEIVLTGANTKEMQDILNSEFRPFTSTLLVTSENSGELSKIVPVKNYKPQSDMPTAYVCENYKCNPPISNVEEFREFLNAMNNEK